MKLIKLTLPSGAPMFVNPESVIAVYHAAGSTEGCPITQVDLTAVSPPKQKDILWVQGTPEEVAALLQETK